MTSAADAPQLFLFAGGGTGGHLFPTLAIAEQLRERLGDRATCRFLCSNRPIDASILTREGADFLPCPASPPTLRPRGLLRFLRGWGPSVRLGRSQIRAAREAGVRVTLIASGGFVAAPLVQAARVEKCRIVMLNLDAVPGKANRWIARHADQIYTTARVGGMVAAPGSHAEHSTARSSPEDGCAEPQPRHAAQWEFVPPIVRRGALPSATPQDCRRSFGLDADRPTLLVTGGSQGATSINRFVLEFVRRSPDTLSGWQVIHQTGGKAEAGERDASEMASAYERAGIRSSVRPFLEAMGQAWGAADLCVCRAGAGNVGEAWATRTPCLFMPYPYHKDGHQRANAMPLVEAGAGVLAHDLIEPEANMHEAGTALDELLRSESARERLREGLTGLGPADGAQRVAAALMAMR